ncbi:fasciclin domain-containing protein [Mycobacterium sp. C31M]
MTLTLNTRKLVGAACTAAAASGLLFASAGVAQAEAVGPGCAAYAAQNPEGPASITGMSMDPVAVAASNNPMLKTLTQAVSGQLNPNVNLVDTLNSAPSLTVFAPTDEAFAKIDPATLETLKTDSALLTSILTYHVVEGQAGPEQVVGMHKTMQGAEVNVTAPNMAMPAELKVNDTTNVVCGGVQTANATVYLVDTVLMPPM